MKYWISWSACVLWTLALASPGLATEEALCEWRDRTRDVYVDGALRSDARVWARVGESAEYAVWLPDLEQAMIVDADSLEVRSIPAATFVPTEELLTWSAPPPSANTAALASAVEVAAGHLFVVGQHSFLIAPHAGGVGPASAEQLWQTVPTWQTRMEAYKPAPEVVSRLAAIDQPTQLTVAFGSWCGDSRRSVPRLLKTLELAANPLLTVDLVAIGRGFTEPLDFVRDQRITNVPTILVHQDGREVGRFIERPRTDNVETDLAAILEGDPPLPRATFAESDQPLARGRYLHRSADGKSVGEESWRLFATENGGRRLHCVRHEGEKRVEVWQRADAQGAWQFLEVTRSDGDELSRSRMWRDAERLNSTTRGNVTGIVKQTAELAAGTVLLSPSAAAMGEAWSEVGRPRNEHRARAFVVDTTASGSSEPLSFDWLERGAVQVAAGEMPADHVLRRLGRQSSHWWFHADLGLPVRGTFADGRSFELAELEVMSGDD